MVANSYCAVKIGLDNTRMSSAEQNRLVTKYHTGLVNFFLSML